MDGVVKFVNEEMYLFVVETENGFTVFEFMETDYIEIGDVVTGALESTDCGSIFNHSRNDKLEVYVRDFVTTLDAAEDLVVYCD